MLRWVNRRAEAVFACSGDELIGNSLDRLLPERYRAAHRDHFAAYARDPRTRPMGAAGRELVGLRKGGEEFPAEVSLGSLTVDDERLVLASVRDIGERHAAEAAVQRSERRLQTIIDAQPACVKVVSSDGILLEMNRAGLRMVGADEQSQVVGRQVSDLVHPADREQFLRLHREASRGSPGRCEFRIVGLGGDERWVDSHFVPLESSVDGAGDRHVVLGVTSDITDRVRAQHALDEAEERMRFALEASGLGVWEADLKTGVSHWSGTCEVMHGLERGTFGRTFDAFIACIHGDDRPDVIRAIDEAIRDRRHVELEYRTVWPDGTERRISTTAHFFYDETGVPERGTGISLDVTERRSLEAQLRQANKMEAVGQLAGGIAHDFNNLLTAISGFTEIVLETLEHDDTRREDLFEVRNAAAKAAALTRQLLAFSRRQILQPKVIDVNALVDGIEKLLRRTIGEDIALVRMFDRNLAPVRADPGQLEQVLLNLAVNARDAMPRGGELRFVTEMVDVDRAMARTRAPITPGRYVRLTVRDTGVGMSPEVQSHIFEPFFTTKGPHKGTGLGLATVYGIVKQSDGFVWVTSRVDAGTSFEIYLPPTQEAVEAHLHADGSASASRGSETILLAEDDGSVRQLARLTLANYGYTVLEARDGEEALRIARSDRQRDIHLLVTDVVMPGLSGRDVAGQLLQERPGLRVLYTSGYAEPLIAHAEVEGGLPLLPKPFLPRDLLRRVREALDAPSGSAARAGA
jgi:PAS domain S-box-containing protein